MPVDAQGTEWEPNDMGKTPRNPSPAKRPARAPLATAALILDWATLAVLGAATIALAISTRLPARRSKAP
jgi:hypothetical protein